jgi:VCBS repeat-containing protein
MWTWFTTRNSGTLRQQHPSLRERLEDRILFDAAPEAPVAPPDQPVDDPFAPSTDAENAPSVETLEFTTQVVDEPRTEVVFVDKRVGNYEALLSEVLEQQEAEVYFLDRNSDGVEQIRAALAGRTDIDALHIISHGDQGQLLLGTATLTQQSMQQVYASTLRAIGGTLAESGDILVYGCEFAKGAEGVAATRLLSQLTGADVAASSNDTGHENLQADWVLEVQVGTIEAPVIISEAAQQQFGGVLAETIAAFLISDSTDQVIKLTDRTNTSTAVLVGPMTNTFSVEALVRDITTGNIYASDANRFGIVNLETGTVTVLGNYGTIGSNALDQVISLTVHPTTGEIWAVDSTGSGPDYLFKVNKTTGAYIPNAFGAGVHHIAVDTNAAGVGQEIDDLAWGTHPTIAGQYVLYASMSNRLISINTTTGAVTAIGTSFGTNITDMEGLSADENGNLWGTTGNSSGLTNRVWTINKTTGAATQVGQVPIGGDFEGIVFLTQSVDLDASITVSNTAPLVGDTVTYTITLRNTDPNILASGVQLRSLVPTGLTFVSATASKGTYTNGTGLWNIGVMNANTTQTLTITYTVNAGTAGTTITRVAEIYRDDNPDPDSDVDNNVVGEDDQGSVSLRVNTAPTTANSSVTGVEDGTYTFTSANFPYTDANSDPLAAIRITSLPATGSLRYNGVAITAAQIAAGFDVLAANIGLLTFVPAANQNGSNYTTFGFQVSDGYHRSATSTMTVNVTAVNDAPTLTVPGAQSATAGVSKVLSGISIADIDAGSSNVTVTFSIPAGTLTLNTGVSGGIVAGEVTNNGTGTVTVTSTIAKINATLANATGLSWLYNSSGTQTLTVNVNDLGNTGVDPSTVGQPATGTATNEQASGTVAITIPAPSLSINSVTVVEGTDTHAVFTVSLSNPTTMAIVMNLALTAGTATGGGTDYGAAGATNLQVWNGSTWVNATTATIAAGATSVQVRTPITDDFRSDNGETFTLGATVTSGTTSNASASGTGTINDEAAGAGDITYVSIAGPATVNEGATTTSYTVSLTQPAVTDVTVTLTYTGTAANGTDYTAQTTVTILAGTSSRTFTLPTTGDNLYEGNEPFNVAITGTSGGGLERLLIDTANDDVTTTIVDDDTPTLSINNMTVTEGTDSHAVFTLSLSNPSTENVVVTLTLTNGTATVGTDTGTSAQLEYHNGTTWVTVPGNRRVTIAAGTTSLQVRTAIANDTTVEVSETYTLAAAHFSGTLASTADIVGTGTILDNDSSNLTITDVTQAEGNSGTTTYTFTVSLTQTVDTAVSINWATAHVTTNGTDLTAQSGTVTIAAGSTSQTFSVTVNGDQTVELDESFNVNLSGLAAGGRNVTVTDSQGVGSVTNDDAASLTINDVTQSEGNSGTTTYTFTVSLDRAVDTAVSVNWATANGTTNATDLAAQSGTVTIAAGSTSQTFSVTVSGDQTVELNETFNVNLSGLSAGSRSATVTDSQGVGTITNDDAASMTIGDVTQSEGNSGTTTYTFTVALDRAVDTAVSVNWATANGTTNGADLAAQSGSVTFAAGETSKTITITTSGDQTVELNETFNVNLSGLSAGGRNVTVTDSQGVGTITNDDAASLTINDVTQNEGNSGTTSYTFTLTLDRAVDAAVSIDWATANGTTNATDLAVQSGTVTFAAGELSKTITVTTSGDQTVELNEAFNVNLSNLSNGGRTVTVTDSQGVGTLTNDDAASMTINDVTQVEGNSGTTTYTFTVSLDRAVDAAVAVDWATANSTTNGSDLAAQSGTVSFAAGETTKTFSVTVNGDQTVELNEAFNVNLSNLSNGGRNVTVTDSQGVGTVTNDDAAVMTIDDVSHTEGDSGTVAYTFTVTLDRAVDAAVSVNWATAHVSTDGSDLAPQSGSVTFAAGELTKTFTVNMNSDTAVELNESFNVNLSGLSAGGRSVTIGDAQGVGTIVEDDGAQVSIDDVSQIEGDSGSTTYTFTISLDQPAPTNVSVDWATAHSTTNGTDLAAQSGSVTFVAGETSKTISVTVNRDQTIELDESFFVNLSNLSTGGSAVVIGDAQGVGTIVNDDDAAITIDDVTQSEGDSGTTTYTFTVSLDQPVDTVVSVNWATAHGTTNGTDLSAPSGTVTFAAGETTKTFSVTVSGDTTVELNETFNVNLSGLAAGGRSVAVTDSQGVGTITNDDVAAIAIDDITQSEGDSGTTTYTFTVTLSQASDAPVSVNWATANGTTNGTDLGAQSGTVTFAAGETSKTFTVNINGDRLVEGDDTFTVNLSGLAAGGRSVTISDAQGFGTLVNDDNAPSTLTHTVTTAEDTDYNFTITDIPYFDADGDPLVSITITSLPTDGSLIYNGVTVTQTDIDNGLVIAAADIGQITFRPDANENGLLYASFGFLVSDGVNESTPALMRVHVTPVNDPPIARNNQYTVLEDGSGGGNVITDNTGAGVDSDIDGGTLFIVDIDGNAGNGITPVVGPANGTLVLNSNGTFTYMPNSNYNGGDSFTYRISDGNGGFSEAVVTLTVTPVNDAPTATNNTAGVTEDGPTTDTGNLLTDNDGFGVDADIDLDPLAVKQVRFGATTVPVPGSGTVNIAGLYGTLTISATGSYTYTLNNALAAVQQLQVGEILTEVFQYTATDGTADAAANLTVTINGRNDDPVRAGTIPNQSDADAETITPVNVRGFFDDADLNDSLAFSALGTLPPGLSIHPTTGVITGMLDSSASQGGAGGVYSVTIQATDDFGRSVTQTFQWTVTNPAPNATNNTGSVTEDGPTTDSGNLLTDNDGAGLDSDPDGDALSVTVVDGVAVPGAGSVVINGQYGQLTIAADGSYTYTLTNNLAAVQSLAAGESLVDDFGYTLSDGEGGSDTATLTITINGRNDAPTTTGNLPPRASVDSQTITPVPVAGAFTDIDNGAVLTFSTGGTLPPGLVMDPQTGLITGTLDHNASLQGNGGVYSVTITATDEHGAQVTRSFNWTVTNPAPIARDNTATVGEDGPQTDSGNLITDNDGTGRDHDPDGDSLAILSVDGLSLGTASSRTFLGQYGTLEVRSDGTYTYTLNGNLAAVQALAEGDSLQDTFDYIVTDYEGGSDTAQLVVTINGANDPPVADDDANTTDIRNTTSGNVLPNDSDPNTGDTLTVVAVNGSAGRVGTPVTLPSGAILVLNADGTYTYDPNGVFDDLGEGQSALDTFTYMISDGHGGFDTATVVITITGLNAPPEADDDVRRTPLDTPVTVSVLENDTDPNGDPLSVILLGNCPHGTTTVNPDGTITFTPYAGFTGMAYIRYLAEDPFGASSPATIAIMVDPQDRFIFGFDSFNNFSRPRQILSELGHSNYHHPYLTQEIFSLAPNPIFSGYARPGSLIVGRIYDERGVLIGEGFAHADPGGNWMMQFQGVEKFENYRIEFDHVTESQDIYGYLGLDPENNSYQAMQPLTDWEETLSVNTVTRRAPFQSLQQLHRELTRPLGFGDR